LPPQMMLNDCICIIPSLHDYSFYKYSVIALTTVTLNITDH